MAERKVKLRGSRKVKTFELPGGVTAKVDGFIGAMTRLRLSAEDDGTTTKIVLKVRK